MKHIVLTPVYNEENFLHNYIESIIRQTVQPQLLLLIDDNSTDNSLEIMQKYSRSFNWVEYLHHPAEQKKVQGSKVIEAFNFGLEHLSINLNDIDIISKIDADLELPNTYFEIIIDAFKGDDELGLVGGTIFERQSDKWVKIPSTDYHVRGALKSYRTLCFIEIGGLMPVLGWDGLDEMKLFYSGWKTRNLNLAVKHFRPADNDYNSVKLSIRRGIHNYKNGGNLFLAIIRSSVRIKDKPYFIIGLMYFYGYIKAMITRENKNVDKDLARFINKFHIKRLFKALFK